MSQSRPTTVPLAVHGHKRRASDCLERWVSRRLFWVLDASGFGCFGDCGLRFNLGARGFRNHRPGGTVRGFKAPGRLGKLLLGMPNYCSADLCSTAPKPNNPSQSEC